MLNSKVVSTSSIWSAVLLAISVFDFAGCSTPPGGKILVGQPEVFTRQRLVNRRLTEQQWLEDQLAKNTPATTTFQGYQDVREFSGLYSKTSASFDPLAGKLAVAQNDLGLKNLQNQSEISSLQHQIDLLKLQQQLIALQNANNANGTPSSGSTSGGNSASGSGTTSSNNAPSTPSSGTSSTGSSSTNNPVSSNASSAPSSGTIFNSPPALPSPSEAVTTQAKVTSIELLRDQLAWRNSVHAALREQELDDAHDLNGLTLYTLKFDLAVLSPSLSKNTFSSKVKSAFGIGDPNNRYGKVKLNVRIEEGNKNAKQSCEQRKAMYESWLFHVRAAVHMEAVAFEKRIELGMLSQEEQVRLATARAAWDPPITAPQKTEEEKDNAKPSVRDLQFSAARFIGTKYKVVLGELVSIDPKQPLTIQIDNRIYYVPDIKRSTALGEYLDESGNYTESSPCKTASDKHPYQYFVDGLPKQEPYVFVADPKEQAQNISDVAAAEQLRNMVLSLQAVLPQFGLNASNYTEYMSRSQQRLQGILRRPLVVAYSDGKTGNREFGWILGPRWELGADGQAQFNHTTVQHSVQVSVVVPGWVRKLEIPYETSWLNEDGTCESVGNTGVLHVELPADDSAITTRLLAVTGTRRIPFIEPPTGPDNKLRIVRLQAKQPGDILLHGENLWRNPKVFVGAQAADSISVLPDMSGLSAHFNLIAMPPAKAKENPLLDITVVTSEGIATLAGAAQVFPEGLVSADKFVVSLETPLVLQTAASNRKPQPLTLSAPADAVPDAFNQLAFLVRPLLPREDPATNKRPFETLKGEVILQKQDKKTLFIAPGPPPGFDNWPDAWATAFGAKTSSPAKEGWIMEVKLAIAKNPLSPIESVSSADGKPLLFAFFPTEEKSHGSLSIKGTGPASLNHGVPQTYFDSAGSFSPALNIGLGGDTVFEQAYSGLKQALQMPLTISIAEVKNDATHTELGSTKAILTSENTEFVDGKKQLPVEHSGLDELLAKNSLVVNSLPTRTAVSSSPDSSQSKSEAKEAGPAAWLRKRLDDNAQHFFKLSIVLSPDTIVPIGPIIGITAKK